MMILAAVWGLMMAMVGEMKAGPEDKTPSGRSSALSRQSSRLEIVNSYPGLSLQQLKQRQKSFHEQFQQALRKDAKLATEWNALQQLREGLNAAKKQGYELKDHQNGAGPSSRPKELVSKEQDEKGMKKEEKEKTKLFEDLLEKEQGPIAASYAISKRIAEAIRSKTKNKPSSF